MASTLTVGNGTGYQYHTIASAIAASQNGDTIQVQAGTYTNDTAIISTSIKLEAVGGRVVMNETTAVPNQKGILVVGTHDSTPTVSIDGFDFTGAQTPNGNNGAGIRYQNGNLTLTNDYFHNNQNGILATPTVAGTGSVNIDHSEFGFNGTGDGLTHNIYIGDVGSFTLTNSYSHDTAEGHEVKSRAENNTITNNRIFDNNSTSSYSIDLPNGGNAQISGNTIQQGANQHNPTIIAYGEEGNLHSGSNLQISNNTIVNDASSVTMLWNKGNGTAQLSDNKIFGIPAGKILSGAGNESGDTTLTTRPTLDTTSHPFGTTTSDSSTTPNTSTTTSDDNSTTTPPTNPDETATNATKPDTTPGSPDDTASTPPDKTASNTITDATPTSPKDTTTTTSPDTNTTVVTKPDTTPTVKPDTTPTSPNDNTTTPTSHTGSTSTEPNLNATFDPNTHKVHITGHSLNNSPVFIYGAGDGKPVGPGTGTGFTTIKHGNASSFATTTATNAHDTFTVESVQGGVVDRATVRIASEHVTFNLHEADVARDLLSGMRVGQDHLHVTGANGMTISDSAEQSLIAGATSDTHGNAVLHLSPSHNVTLSGVTPSNLSTGMFA